MEDKKEATTIMTTQETFFYVPVPKNEMLKICVAGLAVGAIAPLMSALISNNIIDTFFCKGVSDICTYRDIVANHISVTLLGLAVFAVFMQINVYRALLLVLSSIITTWSFAKYAEPILANSSLEYYLLSILLYTLVFTTFYWLLRIKNFGMSFAIVALTTTCACVALAV